MPKKKTDEKPNKPAKTPPLVTKFENKAGHYELIRVDGDQAYYSFTNLHGKTVDAVMTVTMWRRMQQKAASA